jgi:hypothetical protein
MPASGSAAWAKARPEEGRGGGNYKTTGVAFTSGGSEHGYDVLRTRPSSISSTKRTASRPASVRALSSWTKNKSTTTKMLKDDVYAFIFGQKDSQAGLGVQKQDPKITPK